MLEDTLKRVKMFDEAKAQMKKGLEGYKNNGEEWDFKSPGLHDTVTNGAPNTTPNANGEIARSWSWQLVMLTWNDI